MDQAAYKSVRDVTINTQGVQKEDAHLNLSEAMEIAVPIVYVTRKELASDVDVRPENVLGSEYMTAQIRWSATVVEIKGEEC